MSPQELARRYGMTRQAMHAIEAGPYGPRTLVAMRLAKTLGCRVEDLFHLTDAPRQLEAEWLGELSAADVHRTRSQLARVGHRWRAHPLVGAGAFSATDGLTRSTPRPGQTSSLSTPWVTVDL